MVPNLCVKGGTWGRLSKPLWGTVTTAERKDAMTFAALHQADGFTKKGHTEVKNGSSNYFYEMLSHLRIKTTRVTYYIPKEADLGLEIQYQKKMAFLAINKILPWTL